MADFCKQCNQELFDLDEADFSFDPSEPLTEGQGFLVLCEGCGPILVDHKGNKIAEASSETCKSADEMVKTIREIFDAPPDA